VTRPTILLTGATGHLGAAIAREFVSVPGAPRLRILVRDEKKLCRLAATDPVMGRLLECERVVGDIRDADLIERAVAGVDTVIHACHSHEYWSGASHIFDVNVGGASNLQRAIRTAGSVKKVVFIGSYSAHQVAAVEDDRQSLCSASARECSSRSKRLAQAVFQAGASAGSYRLDVVSPSYLIGPMQLEPTYFCALFHLVLLKPLRWCPPNGINVVDVRDVASTVMNCATGEHAAGRQILASGDNVSLRELFAEMNHQAGFGITPRSLPREAFMAMPSLRQFGAYGRQYFRRNHYVDTAGLSARHYALRDSIRDTLSWARQSPLYRRRIEFIRWVAQRYLF
jgi:nucleoside-diphosphate-sugar epimerase